MEMRTCEHCGCKTNARMRACCWRGRNEDLGRIPEPPTAADFQSDSMRLVEAKKAIKKFQAVIYDQEVELVNLRVEACLRANEFNELLREFNDFKASF